MPCGLIVFDCQLLVVVVILVELVVSRPIFIDKDQRNSSINHLMKKDRRHSIFDDKNKAVLGELVRTQTTFEKKKNYSIRLFLAYIFK